MLNPSLTPPPRVWPAWVRGFLVLLALGWIALALWRILQVRAHDDLLIFHGQATFLAERKVAAVLWALALVVYLIAISAAIGLDLIVRNFQGTLAPVVAFPVHLALGLGVFSVLFFLLGLAEGGYGLWVLVAVLLAGGVNVLRWHRYRSPSAEEIYPKPPEAVVWHVLVIGLTIIAAAAAVAPATDHDDLVYHLESPHHMIVQGEIDVPDWNLYARFPNLLHGVYIPLLALDPTEAAPRLLTVFLGLLIAYCLYRIGGLWFSSRAGGIAGLLFLTTPMVLDRWSTAGLDIAGAFFITVSVLALAVAPMARAYAHVRLAGVLAGCALACRLTSISAIAGLLVLVWACWSRHRRDAEDTIGLTRPGLIRLTVAFLWPLALVQVPFLLHSWAETGNPIFPFRFDLFGGEGWSEELTAGAAHWQHSIGMGHSLGDFALLPWRLVARAGANFYERFAGVLHPWYLILAPLALVRPEHFRRVMLLTAMLAVAGAVWFLTAQQARFLIPVLPWAALIGGVGFDGLAKGFSKRMRPWASGSLAVVLAGTGLLLVAPRDLARFSDNVLVALTHGRSREVHLREHLSIHPAVAYLNARQAVGADGVLLLWDNRGHHLEMPWIADPVLEVPRSFLRWKAMSTEEILIDLRREGISHIVVRTDWRDAALGDPTVAIDRATHDAIWGPLERDHLEEVFAEGVHRIYRVRGG